MMITSRILTLVKSEAYDSTSSLWSLAIVMENSSAPIKVEIVTPIIQDPWRTRGEYIEEQRQQKWQFRLTVCALIVSIIASLAAVVSAYAAIKALNQLVS